MFRPILPAAIWLLAHGAHAQTLTVPGLTDEPTEQASTCKNVPYSTSNCVRVLACVGDGGVYFDGEARGWDTGSVTGYLSNGPTCTGTWTSNGLGGTGLSSLTCDGGIRVDVIYFNQDNETGTVIGSGRDSLGRNLRVWTGENVLAYLSSSGAPALPCAAGAIPIS